MGKIDIDLTVKLAGLKIRSPFILASGILGLSSIFLRRVSSVRGIGAVTSKSIGLKPREGYPNPTVVVLPYGLLNAMGLPNPGLEAFLKELDEAGKFYVPLIVSFYGYELEELKSIASRLDKHPLVSALEFNASCPHVSEVFKWENNPELIAEAVSQIKKNSKKPLFVKISPNTHLIVDIARAAAEAGADGVTAVNTIRAMAIDIELCKPILSNIYGGLSGPALKPIAVRCVYEIYKEINIPIIGCGGVSSYLDAVEFLLAGASAIGIGSAISFKGLSIFEELTRGLVNYMKRKGFRRVEELVGLSHR